MSDQNHFQQPQGEIDLMDVLDQQGTLYVHLPSDPALAQVCLDAALCITQRAAVRSALRPLLDQMKFDLAAAERGAMPPANAD